MNSIIQFLENKYFQIGVIIVLILIIVWLLRDNNTDTFTDYFENEETDFSRVPPHIEKLEHSQLIPQMPPAASQEPSRSPYSGEYIDPPNYHRENEMNTIKDTKMVPGNIYRSKTGRDAYEEEQFVSIYDANFGGMLGTTMGLN
jgi:hypothetical protein